MLTALRTWFGGSAAPKAAVVDDLLGKIRRLRDRFPKDTTKAAPDQAPRLQLIDAEETTLKGRLPLDANGKVDSAKWEAKPEDERSELCAKARRVFDELRCLLRQEQIIGRAYFLIFMVIFVAAVGVYVIAHWTQWESVIRPATDTATAQKQQPSQRSTGLSPEKIVAVVRELRRVELAVSAQRDAKPTKEPPTKDEQEKLNKAIAATKSRVADLKREIDKIDLSFNTLQLLGTIEADAENETLPDNTDSLTKVRPALLADLDSLRAGFFWNDRVWRWIEIAWWAELGVLVGILFYIAGIMGEGRFETENIAMFWTEVVIAPVVVLVIFFLFTLTGITGISPGETALPGNVGFAFIFGFAIRRTLGLLDTIKKRIFPEPAP